MQNLRAPAVAIYNCTCDLSLLPLPIAHSPFTNHHKTECRKRRRVLCAGPWPGHCCCGSYSRVLEIWDWRGDVSDISDTGTCPDLPTSTCYRSGICLISFASPFISFWHIFPFLSLLCLCSICFFPLSSVSFLSFSYLLSLPVVCLLPCHLAHPHSHYPFPSCPRSLFFVTLPPSFFLTLPFLLTSFLRISL